MRSPFIAIAIGIIACLMGIGSAYIVLDGNLRFGKVELGQWNVWPLAGEPTADPYTKAYLARSGTVWMTVTEGLSLATGSDSDGKPLLGSCTYELSGQVPRGRLWTLAPQGKARSNSAGGISEVGDGVWDSDLAGDTFISSSDIVWNEDETLTIMISREAKPGNWLRLSTPGRFRLMLRIYDTPLTSGALDSAIRTPLITRRDCA